MELRYLTAIVKSPSISIVNSLSTSELGKPDPKLAEEQHKDYIAALIECGCEVEILPADEAYPDSCFLEGPVLCTPHGAIINRLGEESRSGEEQDPNLRSLLETYYGQQVVSVREPGTVEGSDILMVDDHYFIGLSSRTNLEGAKQVALILESWALTCTIVEIKELFYLKSGIAYLQNNKLLVREQLINHPVLTEYEKIAVVSEESYAANSIWVNGTVIMPKGYPKTKQALLGAGYSAIREVDTSEIKRLSGGLSCCSLRLPSYIHYPH